MPLFPACSQHDSGVAKHHQKHSQHGQGGGDVEKCAAETSDAQVDPSLVKFLLPKLLTALQLILVQPVYNSFHVEKHWPISRHGQNGQNGQNGIPPRFSSRPPLGAARAPSIRTSSELSLPVA